MTLPLPVVGAINLFTTTWPAFDRVTTILRGRSVKADEPAYDLSGSIQYMGEKELKLLPENFQSEGGIIIRTQQTLFFLDNSATAGNTTRQTFVLAYGERWRVLKEAQWQMHGDYRKYVAVKHVERS